MGTVKGQVVTVRGPRGTLKRDFSHLKVELKKTGPQALRITKWWATMKQKAALRTVSSHIKKMATESRSEISSEKRSTEKSKCCQASKSLSPQNKRMNSGSKVTTSKTSAEVAPWFTTKPSFETRISESSSMVSTFPRKPKLARITNFSDSKLISRFFVSVKS